MNAIVSLVLVLALLMVGLIGGSVPGLQKLFGGILPLLAFGLFLFGLIYRVIKWARVPVPFRIPTTGGQQRSLPWIKHDKLDNPFTKGQVLVRMFLEVFLFRSLFRNTSVELPGGRKVAYAPAKLLWLAGLAFHWTFLIIVIRHFRFFLEPVPSCIVFLQEADGFFQIATPTFFLSSIIFLGAVTVLFLRRVVLPHVRYISLAADYFPLFLILAIGLTGVFMRYILKVDIVKVKELTMGLASLSPTIPEGIGSMFYAHILLVSVLLAYFPFSKLLHAPGVFMSPTRNLASNNRAVRHVNPWNYPVHTHTYEEYEDEFRERMIAMNIPVDKQPENKPTEKE